jgi:hypothetical protein
LDQWFKCAFYTASYKSQGINKPSTNPRHFVDAALTDGSLPSTSVLDFWMMALLIGLAIVSFAYVAGLKRLR